MSPPSVFILGATGLIGSHLLLELKKNHPIIPVTVYIRKTELDEYLSSVAGVKEIVHGDFDTPEKISSLAEEADIVIDLASSPSARPTEALLEGLKRRAEKGKTSTLIHMSGTANFTDKRWADGSLHEDTKIWSDDSVEDMKLISPNMPNGAADYAVLQAGVTHPGITTHIISPSGILGSTPEGFPIRTNGVLYNFLLAITKEVGYFPYMGDGTALFNIMPLGDVVDFTMRLFSMAIDGTTFPDSPYERTYALGGAEMAWKDVAPVFARHFHSRGLLSSPEAKAKSAEELAGTMAGFFMNSSMRFVSPRAERLGSKRSSVDLAGFLDQLKG